MGIMTKEGAVPPYGLLKRLGTNDTSIIESFLALDMGEVLFSLRLPYSGNHLIHSFSNVASIGEFMMPGSTHVAVGFVDLSQLAAAVARWDEEGFKLLRYQQQQQGEGGEGGGQVPLKWVGYEASAPAVAKTLVVCEMLRQGAAAEEVTQVSSAAVK
jgi:hypothetical protein